MARRDPRAVAVLVSGGADSAAMLWAALRRGDVVWPVYFREGHAWERAERHWLRRLLAALRTPRLKPLSVLELPVADCYRSAAWSLNGRGVPSSRTRDEAVYLPGRNILLLAKGAVFCAERGLGRIALGILGRNPFPDASPAFLRQMSRALASGLGARLRVETPLRTLAKTAVLARARGLPWELTFSCIAPRGLRHCGRCNKCGERRAAFRAAGVGDPTRYAREEPPSSRRRAPRR